MSERCSRCRQRLDGHAKMWIGDGVSTRVYVCPIARGYAVGDP